MSRIALIDFAILGVGAVVAAGAHLVTWRSLGWEIPSTGLLLAVFYARFGWISRGEALLDSEGIRVKGWTGKQFYPWRDVSEISVETMRVGNRWNQAWLRICSIDLEEPIARLQLTRSPRVALFRFGWRESYGTDEVGLPLGSGRRVFIPARDPAGLVSAALERFATYQDLGAAP